MEEAWVAVIYQLILLSIHLEQVNKDCEESDSLKNNQDIVVLSAMAFSIPPDFNPVDFIYLNPDVVSTYNVTSATQALSWALSNDVSNLLISRAGLPDMFDAKTYLLSSKDVSDISLLSDTIAKAMATEGFSTSAIEARAMYIDNIYRNALLISSNELQFDNPANGPPGSNFQMTLCNLRGGDFITFKAINTSRATLSTPLQYAQVSGSYLSNDKHVIILSNLKTPISKPIGTNYLVHGIKAYDIDRIATINYLKCLARSNISPVEAFFVDTTFNPGLYRMLYPRVGNMTDTEAYIDYIAMTCNNTNPVGKVEDLITVGQGNSNAVNSPFDNLTVTYQMRLPYDTSTFVFKDSTVYGISQDNRTRSSILLPGAAQPKLITEYAIKKYIDRSYEEEATFCNVVVNGNAIFNGEVNLSSAMFRVPAINTDTLIVTSNATVGGNTYLQSNVYMSCDLEVTGIVDFKSNLHLSGDLQVDGESKFLSNVAFMNHVVHECNETFNQNVTFNNTVEFWSNTSISNADIVNLNCENAQIALASMCNVVVDDLQVTNASIYHAYIDIISNRDSTATAIYTSNIFVSHELESYLVEVKDTIVASNAYCSNLTTSNLDVITYLRSWSNAWFGGDVYVTAEESLLCVSNLNVDYAYGSNTTVQTFAASNASISEKLTTFGQTMILGECNFIRNVTLENVVSQGAISLRDDAWCLSNVHVVGTTYGPRIGIGFVDVYSNQNVFTGSNIGLRDASFCNINVAQNAVIGNDTTYGQNVLTVKGNVTADAYNNTSDRRLKKDVVSMNSAESLGLIRQLRPIAYQLYDSDLHIPSAGFYADELEKLVPDAVFDIGERRFQCSVQIEVLRVDVKPNKVIILDVCYVNQEEQILLESGDELILNGKYDGISLMYCNGGQFRVLANQEFVAGQVLHTKTCVIKSVKSINYQYLIPILVSGIQALADTLLATHG